MHASRLVAFIVALSTLIGIHLLWAWATGLWHLPRIPEAAEVMGYYFWIIFAIVCGLIVVGALGFPAALAADRLFQRRKMSRAVPYLFFVLVSLIVSTTLVVSREGELHMLDLPAAVIYFAAASSIVWKLAFEVPKRKNA